MHSRSTFTALALAALSLLSPMRSASAQTVTLSGQGSFHSALPSQFSLFSPGAFTFSMVLPSSPATADLYVYSDYYNPDHYAFEMRNAVPAVFTQGPTELSTSGYITVTKVDDGMQFAYVEYHYLSVFALGGTSTQSFTSGSSAAPTFVPGTYTVSQSFGQSTVTNFRIDTDRIDTNTTVPEPSTYALMAAGLAGLGLLQRRRRRA